MIKKIFFQSSLPRSGSTLLQNVMGQNPEFYVTPTSGVLELLYASRGNFTNSPEFKAQDSKVMTNGFRSFLKSGLEGFYNGITDKPYILDKSRGWGIHYDFINEFYPNPKIICMVRDLRGIYASMEKNFRKNQLLDSGIVNHSQLKGTSTEKRVDIWANTQPVGLAIERLYQMIKEGIDKKVHFVRFEDFCENPKNEMNKIYEFLGVAYYEHDFLNVEQITQEDDSVYGIYGDHKIKKEITPLPADYGTILGTNTCVNIRNNYKWFYDYFNYGPNILNWNENYSSRQ
jgi:sulfotransferase